MRAVYFDGKKATVKDDYPECTGKDVTVNVTLAGICGTDIEILSGYMKYIGVPGHEFVGVVKEDDSSSMAGMRVAGEINCGCQTCSMCRRGLQRHCPTRTVLGILNHDGAFAEKLMLPESNLHTIPDSMSDEQSVFIEPLAAALEILDQVSINQDWKVAIVGDGRLAHLICQVIKAYGHLKEDVTCFGRHMQKMSPLQRFGIQTKKGIEETDRHKFDMVIEASGSTSGFTDAINLVKPRGTLVLKSTLAIGNKADLTHAIINEVTLVGSRCGRFKPAIDAIATGAISVSHMTDKTFSLDEFDAAIARAREPDALKVYLKPAA